jgi:hypothetical protein
MGPADSGPLSRVGPYSGTGSAALAVRLRDCHPLWWSFPARFGSGTGGLNTGPTTPAGRVPPVWAGPFHWSAQGVPEYSRQRLPATLRMTGLSPILSCSKVRVLGLFPGRPWPPGQSDKAGRRRTAVTSSGPRNVDLVPIGYGLRPRLRGRLTPRGRAWRRNPWTSGGSVSHAPCRYSCQHSLFRCLHGASRHRFAGLRNAPLPLPRRGARSFGARLEPRYIFGAGQLIDQ